MLTIPPIYLNNPLTNNLIYNSKKITNTPQDTSSHKNVSETYYVQQFLHKVRDGYVSYKNSVLNKPYYSSKIDLNWDHKTDLFTLKFTALKTNKESKDDYIDFYIKINNDDSCRYVSLNKSFLRNENKFEYSINSTQFSKKINFSQIKSISFGYKTHFNAKIDNLFQYIAIGGNTKMETEKYFNIVSKGIEHYKKDVQLNEEEKSINLKFQTGITFYENGVTQNKYQNLQIIPISLEQGKHNTNFLKLEYNDRPFERTIPIVKYISGLPISKEKIDKIDVFLKNKETVFFDKNMYYDLDKKESIIGFHQNSDIGYVIPYNYVDTMFLVLTLDVNEYKDIKFAWSQKINKPYFDKDKGKIKLEINNNYDNIDEKEQIKWLNIDTDFFNKKENKDLKYEDFIKKINEMKKH